MLESQGNYPEPPSNIDLSRPRADGNSSQGSTLDQGLSASAVDQLQQAAQAAQDPTSGAYKREDGQYGDPKRSVSASDGGHEDSKQLHDRDQSCPRSLNENDQDTIDPELRATF